MRLTKSNKLLGYILAQYVDGDEEDPTCTECVDLYIEDAVPKHRAFLHRQDKYSPPLIATLDRPTQQSLFQKWDDFNRSAPNLPLCTSVAWGWQDIPCQHAEWAPVAAKVKYPGWDVWCVRLLKEQVRTLIYSPYLKYTTNDLTQAQRTVHLRREQSSPVNGGRSLRSYGLPPAALVTAFGSDAPNPCGSNDPILLGG